MPTLLDQNRSYFNPLEPDKISDMVIIDRSIEAQTRQHELFEEEADRSLSNLKLQLTNFSEWSQKEGLSPKKLDFGPTYYLRSSGNIDLSIRTIYTEYNHELDSYVLVASSAEGVVVGYRDARIRKGLDEEWSAGGYIYSAIRGKGIATAIDSAHKDFLQRVANQYGHQITWKAYNGNAGNLYLEQRKAKAKQLDALRPDKLEEKVVEQSRWQSLWGPRGKLGMTTLGGVAVPIQYSRRTHDVIKEDLAGIESIYMSRNRDGLFHPVEIERALSTKDRSILVDKKLLAFKAYLATGSIDS